MSNFHCWIFQVKTLMMNVKYSDSYVTRMNPELGSLLLGSLFESVKCHDTRQTIMAYLRRIINVAHNPGDRNNKGRGRKNGDFFKNFPRIPEFRST